MSVGTELSEIALETLEELAPSVRKFAVCAIGPSVYAKPGSFAGHDFLIVCEGYASGLKAQRRVANGDEARFLLVERELVESDINKGTLGDFLTEKFLYLYRPVANSDYVETLGVQAKTRVVKEEVKELVLQYGEMCRGLVAKPEFFCLSKMRKRARVLLPSLEDYLRFSDPAVRDRNLAELRESTRKALESTKLDIVELDDEHVNIPDSTVDRWLRGRSSEQVVNIMTQSRRALYTYLAKGRAVFLDLDLLARELYSPLKLGLDPTLVGREPEDPKNHLYLRTAQHLVPFNDRSSLEDVASRLGPGRPITISPLAGVLNEVFLVTLGKNQFVAKRFTDWHGFKWFTLNLVSFGSKIFALSGRTRMTNEYGTNRYLSKKGLKVPQIVHASVKQRILVEEYVSGTPMNQFVSQALAQSTLTRPQYHLAESLGESLAFTHQVGVAVGDSKPENFVAKEGEIFTVDLEQAGKHGDYAWDIAELLYYAGHYSTTPTPTGGLSELIEAFTRGYARRGDASELRRAAGARYIKVFSLWTAAPIILEISRSLRSAG